MGGRQRCLIQSKPAASSPDPSQIITSSFVHPYHLVRNHKILFTFHRTKMRYPTWPSRRLPRSCGLLGRSSLVHRFWCLCRIARPLRLLRGLCRPNGIGLVVAMARLWGFEGQKRNHFIDGDVERMITWITYSRVNL